MKEIKERTEVALKFYRKYSCNRNNIKADADINAETYKFLQPHFEKNKKFRDLYFGTRSFQDESRNDMALIGYLKKVISNKNDLK